MRLSCFLFSIAFVSTVFVTQLFSSGLDDHLERVGLRGVAEGLVGVEDIVELEAVGDQQLGIDLARLDGLEQHRRGDGVDQPRGDGDIAVTTAVPDADRP